MATAVGNHSRVLKKLKELKKRKAPVSSIKNVERVDENRCPNTKDSTVLDRSRLSPSKALRHALMKCHTILKARSEEVRVHEDLKLPRQRERETLRNAARFCLDSIQKEPWVEDNLDSYLELSNLCGFGSFSGNPLEEKLGLFLKPDFLGFEDEAVFCGDLEEKDPEPLRNAARISLDNIRKEPWVEDNLESYSELLDLCAFGSFSGNPLEKKLGLFLKSDFLGFEDEAVFCGDLEEGEIYD